MIAKIIDETLVVFFPGFIEKDGEIFTNSLGEENAKKTGEWFDLEEKPKPSYDPKTEYLSKNYKKQGNKIVLSWDIKQRVTVAEDIE